MDTVHGNEKYQKNESRSERNPKEKQGKCFHQLHKHIFATVPIYCIHKGSYSQRMIVVKDT